jgi:AcrR family transcriptional regulator
VNPWTTRAPTVAPTAWLIGSHPEITEPDDAEPDDAEPDDDGARSASDTAPFYQDPAPGHHLTHRSGVWSTPGVSAADRSLTDHGKERKQQLVDAAMFLFAERGYSSTRIADICERAGVAKGLFYWYFPTKLDLFDELARTMRRRLRRAQADAMDPGADPLTRIGQGVAASVRFMADHAAYFEFVDVLRADPAIAGTLRSGNHVITGDVVALVAEAQLDGVVPPADPHVLAVGVLGAVASFSSARRNGTIDLSTDELADFVAGWVVRALR